MQSMTDQHQALICKKLGRNASLLQNQLRNNKPMPFDHSKAQNENLHGRKINKDTQKKRNPRFMDSPATSDDAFLVWCFLRSHW